MPRKIRILSEQTINKIAAGEVVENPASVVKELVENALDAGAAEICVEIKGGGRQLIRISDNGIGMERDDALLCLERHATSKIREVEDLQALMTMGFRGEAIPSIAAISKFSLLTCPREGKRENAGTFVIVEGGDIKSCSSAARAPGTTIEVQDLFFNVPVRKKFQKSPSYDTQDILKIMGQFTLGNPSIQFELISDQKSLLRTPSLPADSSFQTILENRIETVLGRDFLSLLCPLTFHKEPFELTGFIGLPSVGRPNRTGQYTFINQRMVQSPLMSFAVREGYGTALATNRYPIFVLHLHLPGTFVDVNVHPQKRDVRLRQELLLKEHIMQGVQNALQKNEFHSSPTISFAPSMPNEPTYEFTPMKPLVAAEALEESFVKPDNYMPVFQSKSPVAAWSMLPRPIETQPMPTSTTLFASLPTLKSFFRLWANLKGFLIVDPASMDASLLPSIKPGEGFILVDQKAAHTRIYYERLMKQRTSNSAETYTQSLLIPITLEFPAPEALLVKEHLPLLQRMGFGIQEFGCQTFVVDAVPNLLQKEDLQSCLQSTIQDILDFQDNRRLQREKDKQMALTASRMAFSAQRKLSLDEAQALLSQLLQCEKPLQCPMGKPTLIYLSSDDLAKLFTTKALL